MARPAGYRPQLAPAAKNLGGHLHIAPAALAMKGKVDGLMIDRMDQNEEIVTRF